MNQIEEEYTKIIKSFPDASIIDNYITHIQIPLINGVYLEIDYKKYPKKPKVVLKRMNGEKYKNLDRMILSLKNWNKNETPSIVELIYEIIKIIKDMQSNVIIIKRELLEGILALSRDMHPKEILGLLRSHKRVVSEFILPPGAQTSDSSGIFYPNRIPLDPSIKGTVHSHPSGNLNPSLNDLNNIFKTQKFHFIIGYPYTSYSCVKCFDKNGIEIPFKTIQ